MRPAPRGIADAEETVRRSEERYRSLFENMLDGFAHCEMVFEEGRPADFRYLAVNRAFEELTGLKDVVGRKVSEVIPGVREAHPELFETYGRVALTGRPERFEIHFEPLDAWLAVSVYSGAKGFFTAVFDNITSRKRAEETVRELSERLSYHAENSPLAVIEWGSDMRLTRWSREAERIFGWRAAEVLGKRMDEFRFVFEEDAPQVGDVAAQLQDGTDLRRFSANRNYRKDGSVADCEWYNSSLLDSSGKLRSILSLVLDVSERRRAEARLRELNETLEERVAERTAEAERRAGQLRALASELSRTEWRERQRLAGVLHDQLQQVLVGAKLNLEALKGSAPEGELHSLVGRVDGLLDQSIAECRSLTLALSPPVLLDAGLAAGLAWLSRRMQKEHGIRVDLAVDAGFEEPADGGVRFFLFDAVRELLFNVAKHSGVREARVLLKRSDGKIEVRVEDRGMGFDPGSLRERGEESGGFGLFSIRQRSELIGGDSTVRSGRGEGTSVTLRVPADPIEGKVVPAAYPSRGDAAEAAPGVPAARVPSGRIRIVIADDHRILRQGLIALLGMDGTLDVVGEAADGSEAVKLARALRPDVVIMDVAMPVMNGVEATRQITDGLPGVRVVGLSMHEDASIVAAMREAGAVDFLTKGGPSDALIAAIHSAVESGGAP